MTKSTPEAARDEQDGGYTWDDQLLARLEDQIYRACSRLIAIFAMQVPWVLIDQQLQIIHSSIVEYYDRKD